MSRGARKHPSFLHKSKGNLKLAGKTWVCISKTSSTILLDISYSIHSFLGWDLNRSTNRSYHLSFLYYYLKYIVVDNATNSLLKE